MKPCLLAIDLHHLGDAVMALPFLRAAKTRHTVSVICRRPVGNFLAGAIHGIKILGCDGWIGAAAVVPKLGRNDVALCAWPDPRAHLLMRRSGAGKRVGFRFTAHNYYGSARPWRGRRLVAGRVMEQIFSPGGAVLTHPLDRAPGGQNHFANWTQLAGVLGWEPDATLPWIIPPAPPPEIAGFLSACRCRNRQILAIHPGGRLPTKRWPIAFFQEILQGFCVKNSLAVVIIKPPGEPAPLACSDDQMVFETTGWEQLAGVFSASDGVLCNDSFASHLAAALARRVVSIFGSGDPAWFAPFGNADGVVAEGICPFRPCVDRCVQPSVICLENLPVALVEAKLRAMFLPSPSGAHSLTP